MADDLVQEACARLLDSDKRQQPYLDRWMFRTIRNLHVDHVRGCIVADRYRHRLHDGRTHHDGDADLEASLALEHVRRLVADLPEEQRSVLLLVGAEGFSYREAAEMPIGTITSRLARARQRILERVQSEQATDTNSISEVKNAERTGT
jgi:RNA polymerase sigma-70 factor (ECF subfamily)